MTRSKRSRSSSDDDDDEDFLKHTRRSRPAINYNEDALLAPEIGEEITKLESEELPPEEPVEEPEMDSDGQFEYHEDESDDMDSDASDDDEDDHFMAKSRMRNFVVDDDEDDDDIGYGARRRRNRLSSRSDRHEPVRHSKRIKSRLEKLYSDEERQSIRDELKDLQTSDDNNSSPKRNLRLRKEVNYTLPPPPPALQTTSNRNSKTNARNGRFGGSGSNNNQSNQIRRLFPTQGPFGGSDITSLYQPQTGTTTIGNVDSSDSEDETIVKPTNPNDLSNTIITANTVKGKNTLADTDPLGIDVNIDFSVIGGLNNYIDQLKEMITLPLLYPEIYSKFHITPPRGVLFHGPPGTGKTLMARALAASCSSQNQKITFFMRKGADCLSKWVGEAERHLRLLFEEAKANQPSIIFFDEIDGLAPVRSSKQEQIHASIVSTLLALMDGMDNRGQVIIIGATNRPDSIDPALRRPGRFDREFYFPLPDLNSRKDILNIHMRKWEHKMSDEFVDQLAKLTKGYGGADLKSLCTESALMAIQRSYPQIYQSNDKLKINLNKIKILPNDFIMSLKKIVPNSVRSTNITNQPLSPHLNLLLKNQLNEIVSKVNEEILPILKKPLTIIEESKYLSTNDNFESLKEIGQIDQLRIFKPRLALNGSAGQGLKYIINDLMTQMDGLTIQILDFNKLFSDNSITLENLIIQTFNELKRSKPSILLIPDSITFLRNLPQTCKSLIKYLINGLVPNDRILIMVEIDNNNEELSFEILDELEEILDIKEENMIPITNPNAPERSSFYQMAIKNVFKTPMEYNDIKIRPKRVLKKLPILPPPPPQTLQVNSNNENLSKKEQVKLDIKLKNSLKVKLSVLMDLFKTKYKKFKKPIIDDYLLIHLFDQQEQQQPAQPQPDGVDNFNLNGNHLFQSSYNDGAIGESNYVLQGDKILEIDTGKTYYNIDLDVIEERLWNGYYSEPVQFLNDLKLILKDSIMSEDRDRILKSNEMLAHASVGVEEIELQFPQLCEQWKDLRRREKLLAEEAESQQAAAPIVEENGENGQVQLQLQPTEAGQVVIVKDEVELKPEPVNIGNIGEPVNIAEPVITEETTVESVANEKEPTPIAEQTTEPVTQSATEPAAEPVTEPDAEPPHEAEEVSSSDEEQYQIPEETVEIDQPKLDELVNALVEKTEGKNLMFLERIYSKIMQLIWDHRLQLDKKGLLADLEKLVSRI